MRDPTTLKILELAIPELKALGYTDEQLRGFEISFHGLDVVAEFLGDERLFDCIDIFQTEVTAIFIANAALLQKAIVQLVQALEATGRHEIANDILNTQRNIHALLQLLPR